MTRLATAIVLTSCLTACGRDTPTAPTPLPQGPLSGTWVGAIDDPFNGPGTLQVQLRQELLGPPLGSVLGGTWAATFPDPTRNASGQIVGFGGEGTVSFTAAPSAPRGCTQPVLAPPFNYSITATATDQAMRGTYRFSTCGDSVAGTMTLQRQ